MKVRISKTGYIRITQKEALENGLESYRYARIFTDEDGRHLKIHFCEHAQPSAYSTRPERPETFAKKIQTKQLKTTELVNKVLDLEYIEKAVFATHKNDKWIEIEKDKKPNPYNKPASWSVGSDCIYFPPHFVFEHGLEEYRTCTVFFDGTTIIVGFSKRNGNYTLKLKGMATIIQFVEPHVIAQLERIKNLEILKEP